MFLTLNSQKLFIYILVYAILKAKSYFIEIEKINYEKGKNLNFIKVKNFQKEKLYISIDFGNYKCRYAYNFGGNKNAQVKKAGCCHFVYSRNFERMRIRQ
jgi:hypothetical protein